MAPIKKMLSESTALLLARTVSFRRRYSRLRGSLDQLYTWLNQLSALCLIVLLSPVLALIAYGIWRTDGAPITFAHYRVGYRAKQFRCFKFRSMVRNSDDALANLLRNDATSREEWALNQKLRRDPRITSIGHFLRRSSLDELPQLFNVLRGDMHLVGPRPVTVMEMQRYGTRKRHYLSVRPGLTGLWQVSGRNNTTYAQRVFLDSEYVERRNPLFDSWILLRTVKVLLTREGAT